MPPNGSGLAGIGAQQRQLAGLVLPIIRIRGCFALAGDIGPLACVIAVEFYPGGRLVVAIGQNRLSGAFRFADAAINAFIRVDHQHVFADIEAVHRTDLHAIHVFAVDAIFGDDIGHWRDSPGLSLYNWRQNGRVRRFRQGGLISHPEDYKDEVAPRVNRTYY